MYIIAIGWGYVILMMALTSSSLIKGLMVAFFLGVLPLWLFIYVAGSTRRRSVADQLANPPHRENTEADHD